MYQLRNNILLLILSLKISSIFLLRDSFKITNVTCNSMNTNYLIYTKCELRHNTTNNIKSIYIYGKLMVKSLDKITVICYFKVYILNII